METKIKAKYITGLINNGYKKVWFNEWVKNFKKGRIHCFLRGQHIYIHFDRFRGWHHKVGYSRHLAKEIKIIKTNWQ